MTLMRAALALMVTAGFLIIVAVMLLGVASPTEQPTMQLMLGSLSTAFGMVLQWHFGSSSGSERKSDLLAQSAPLSPANPPKEPAQ